MFVDIILDNHYCGLELNSLQRKFIYDPDYPYWNNNISDQVTNDLNSVRGLTCAAYVTDSEIVASADW